MNSIKNIYLAVISILIAAPTFSEAANIGPSQLWHNFDIKVCWDDDNISAGGKIMAPEYEQQRAVVQETLEKTWQANSNLKFYGFESCNEYDSASIRVYQTKFTSGAIGSNTGWEQEDGGSVGLNFGHPDNRNSLTDIVKQTIHEFGHAIGFGHEDQRSDTPDYCEYKTKAPYRPGTYIGEWDLDAAVTYCKNKPGNYGEERLFELSAADKLALKTLYTNKKSCVADNTAVRWYKQTAWFSFDGHPNRSDNTFHRGKLGRFSESSSFWQRYENYDLWKEITRAGFYDSVTGFTQLFMGDIYATTKTDFLYSLPYSGYGEAIFGESLKFDGVDDVAMVVANDPAMAIHDEAFSVEGWISIKDFQGEQTILAKQDGDVGYWLGLQNGFLAIKLGDQQGNVASFIDTTKLELRRWNHFSFIVRKGYNDGMFYLNGELSSRFNFESALGSLFAESAPVTFGASYLGLDSNGQAQYTKFLSGILEEISFYKSFYPSSNDIASIYNALNYLKCRPSATLLPEGAMAQFSFDASPTVFNGSDAPFVRVIDDRDVNRRGMVGGGLKFTTPEQRVEIESNEATYIGNTDFTIEFWLQTAQQTGVVLSKISKDDNNYVGPGYQISIDKSYIEVTLATDEHILIARQLPFNSIDMSRPRHIMISVDRDAKSGGVIYVNGMENGRFDPTSLEGNIDNDLDILLAATHYSEDYYIGSLDELTYYDKALTQQDAVNIYEAQSAGKAVDQIDVTQRRTSLNSVQLVNSANEADQHVEMTLRFDNIWEVEVESNGNTTLNLTYSALQNNESQALLEPVLIPEKGFYRIQFNELDSEVSVHKIDGKGEFKLPQVIPLLL